MNANFKNIKGLYVHIPFCDGKCFYCAFYSRHYEKKLAERYLRALAMELKQYPRLGVESVYFGGGTPSLLSLPELEYLCGLVRENVSAARLREWTVEANPGSLTAEKLSLMVKAGVNRISLGAQSFDNSALKWLGRRHNAAQIFNAVEMIKSAGLCNFGLDLIACIPGVGHETWRKTLEKAVALNPKHISVYALTSEEGSRLARAVEERQEPMATESYVRARRGPGSAEASRPGINLPAMLRIALQAGAPGHNFEPHHQVDLLSEDEEIESLNLAENILTDAGYCRYEISNYAQPGFECLHNISCWRGGEYIGLGAAAASHAGLKRWTNIADLEKYIEALEQGKKPPCSVDVLNKTLKQVEMIVFGLRMAEGINKATGKICEKTLYDLTAKGLVANGGERWRLTKRGFHLADYVGAELLARG